MRFNQPANQAKVLAPLGQRFAHQLDHRSMIGFFLLRTFPIALRQVLFVFLARFLDLRKDLVIVKVLARWILSCNRRKQILTQRHLETPSPEQTTPRCEYQEAESRPRRQPSSWRRTGFPRTRRPLPMPTLDQAARSRPDGETKADLALEEEPRQAPGGESQHWCRREPAPTPGRAGSSEAQFRVCGDNGWESTCNCQPGTLQDWRRCVEDRKSTRLNS